QEIEKLRRQIGQEKRMPHKCPWCAGGIESNVSKCRHCTSDIEWVNVFVLEPCKPQDRESVITSQNERKLRSEKKRQKAIAEGDKIVACMRCHKEMQRRHTVWLDDGSFVCLPCKKAKNKSENALAGCFVIVVLVVIVCFFLWLGALAAHS
ncbi:hypothetical protein N9183_01175, partial [bacterium]|nr:hypothetical protein [bacterium]